jgi:ribosomal protein S18 acetylase RimI-like enzyme
MEAIQIKEVNVSDVATLQGISRHTFAETFAADNTEADMAQYMDKAFSIEKLTTELLDEHTEYYFALLAGAPVGYLKLNFGPSQTELRDDYTVEIERIYVLADFHGKGVAQLLYAKAIAVARSKLADFVWLGVWEENPRAIRFYQKNGFVVFDKHTFLLGADEQTDLMMKLMLKK